MRTMEPDVGTTAVTTRRSAIPAVPGPWRGLRHQLHYDLLAQSRNPTAAFFSVALPVLFLVAFSVVGSGGNASAGNGADYYTPATMVIGVVSSTLTNLAVTLTYLREYGLLKRVLVTPLSRSAYLGSRVVASGVLALASVLLLGVVGAVAFGVTPAQPLHLLAAVMLGLTTGSALGVALAALVPSETASAPVANAVGLPLLMLSGAFFPLDQAPAWVEAAAGWLPVTPVVDVAVGAYAGSATAGQLLSALGVCGLWTVLAVLIARWRFSWAPRRRR